MEKRPNSCKECRKPILCNLFSFTLKERQHCLELGEKLDEEYDPWVKRLK